MSAEKQELTYKVTIAGPGHTFERDVDEVVATKLIALAITGKPEPAPAVANGNSLPGGTAATVRPRNTAQGSLATYIRAKGGDQSQIQRFLATAHWLESRGHEPLTASAVSKALSDHHQKRLANPADCLNKNVRKGLCEKSKKDGSFFITPEGLAALEGPAAE
ncbi:MAG: hypothetical protein ACOY6K_21085 [Pseudomonadota bacterium]